MSFEVLEDPRAIVAAVRESVAYSARHRGARRSHTLTLHGGAWMRKVTTADATFLVVPVDGRLERLARRMIRDPESIVGPVVIPPGETDEQRRGREAWRPFSINLYRAEGAKALGLFKSEENAAILEPLLRDPATLVRNPPDNDPAGRVREYYVRKAAYEVLKGWGFDAGRPVIEEPLGRD